MDGLGTVCLKDSKWLEKRKKYARQYQKEHYKRSKSWICQVFEINPKWGKAYGGLT